MTGVMNVEYRWVEAMCGLVRTRTLWIIITTRAPDNGSITVVGSCTELCESCWLKRAAAARRPTGPTSKESRAAVQDGNR